MESLLPGIIKMDKANEEKNDFLPAWDKKNDGNCFFQR